MAEQGQRLMSKGVSRVTQNNKRMKVVKSHDFPRSEETRDQKYECKIGNFKLYTLTIELCQWLLWLYD